MREQERCKQCNKLLYVEWTMTFKQGSPHAVRWEPSQTQEQFCPGHPMMSDTEGWDKLSNEQKDELDKARQHICDYFTALTEDFYAHHPGLKLSWQFTLDATLREEGELHEL